VRVGGDKMDEAITNFVKRKYNLLIGERTAETIKIQIGTAYHDEEVRTMEIKGRDLVAGNPKVLQVNSEEVREALAEPINAILEAVKTTLERTPPSWPRTLWTRGSSWPGRVPSAQPGRPDPGGDRPSGNHHGRSSLRRGVGVRKSAG